MVDHILQSAQQSASQGLLMRNTKPLGSLPDPVQRDAGDAMPPMVCRVVFEEICVLANGDVVCSCADPTGVRVYGNVFKERIDDIYNGRMYQEIRGWQLASKPDSWCPVIDSVCGGRIARATSADQSTGRWVKLLQLEPSSHCNLRCPLCPVTTHFPHDELKTRAYQMLPLATMLDVIDQLPHLETLLFYNFGEPFLHKDAVPFLQEVKRKRPEIFIAISTNGLAFTDDKIRAIADGALVDRIVFSIDGANADSYAKYRVGGQLSRALGHMGALVKALAQAGNTNRTKVIWQYILFDWNDDDAQLQRAKDIAQEIGVEIDWKLTHTEGASPRFSLGSKSFLELTGKSWKHTSGTCEVQLKEFVSQGNVAEGRYLARLTLEAASIVALPGERLQLKVLIENLSGTDWAANTRLLQSDSNAGLLRIGVLLRTPHGRRIQEIGGCQLPPDALKANGRGETSFEIVAPAVPGEYELFIDVVEEDVCWFSERGSPPTLCRLEVGALALA